MMSVSLECCVLSGRGLCGELVTRLEESYRLWCVIVSDLENLMNEEALVHWGLLHQKQIMINEIINHTHLYCECEDH